MAVLYFAMRVAARFMLAASDMLSEKTASADLKTAETFRAD
jgi:hypothetical protein